MLQSNARHMFPLFRPSFVCVFNEAATAVPEFHSSISAGLSNPGPKCGNIRRRRHALIFLQRSTGRIGL
jgi:hypothetical protein